MKVRRAIGVERGKLYVTGFPDQTDENCIFLPVGICHRERNVVREIRSNLVRRISFEPATPLLGKLSPRGNIADSTRFSLFRRNLTPLSFQLLESPRNKIAVP